MPPRTPRKTRLWGGRAPPKSGLPTPPAGNSSMPRRASATCRAPRPRWFSDGSAVPPQIRQDAPYKAGESFGAFQFAAGRHIVTRKLAEAGRGEISATGIAEQDRAASAGEAPEPAHRALCHRLLVADVARGDQLPEPRITVEQIVGYDRDRDLVQRRVEGNGRGRERVDIGGGDACGARLCGGDRYQSRAGAKIEHLAASNSFGVIEHVAGQRLSPGAVKRPKGRRQAVACEAFLGRLPDRGDLGCEMQTNLRDQRRRRDRGLLAYEVGRVHFRQNGRR